MQVASRLFGARRARLISSVPSTNVLVTREAPPKPTRDYDEIDAWLDAEDEESALVASNVMEAGYSRDITLALAPPHAPFVELPRRQLRDLDRLYDVLMEPMAPQVTQELRAARRKNRREAQDADAFFALDAFDATDAESHAYRIRCLGVQRKLSAAHTAFQEMGSRFGVMPDMACFHALADACAMNGDIKACEAVIVANQRARVPIRSLQVLPVALAL